MAAAYLRDPFGRHKGAGFDCAQARLCQPLNQLYLCRERNSLLLVLQAISWTDFDDANKVSTASRGSSQASVCGRMTRRETGSAQADKLGRHVWGRRGQLGRRLGRRRGRGIG